MEHLSLHCLFVVLVLWLHRESKVEGYPLTPDAHDRRRIKIIGYPAPPPPRSFHLAGGETVTSRMVVPTPAPWP